MVVIVLSSPATLTGAEEKKTGPSRFIADFRDGIGSWILKSGQCQAPAGLADGK
jgi:hypothetical protein